MPLIRDIHQRFWRLPQLPWLELRTTSESRQAYKRHSHPQLSLGAIIAGETRCISNGQEYLLRPGELILIPPQSPHSCNPLHERPRSYHMLYLDADWCLTQLPICRRIAACIPRSHSCRTRSFSCFISKL